MNKSKLIIVFLLILGAFILFSNASFASEAKEWTVHNVTVENGITYELSNNNGYIQRLIDYNLSDGDTLYFPDSSYTHMSLQINKSLNIIGNNSFLEVCHTKEALLPGSDHKTLFVLLDGAKGTNISGFKISNPMEDDPYDKDGIIEGYSIFVNGASDIKLSNITYLSLGTGLKISGSENVLVENSIINGSIVGINISNSNKVYIVNNKIYNNIEGITFTANSSNILIHNNNISFNMNNGISFEGGNDTTYSNVTISYNYINSNINNSGIRINSNFPNLKILSNMITSNGDFGIFFDFDANRTGNPTIEYNLIYNNKGYNDGVTDYIFEIQRIGESHAEREHLITGYNYFGVNERSSAALCAKTHVGMIILKISEISKGVYNLSYVKEGSNEVVNQLISHSIRVYLNNASNNFYPTITNGTGILDLRESNFANTSNKLTAVAKLLTEYNINDNFIPKKSVSIYSNISSKSVVSGKVVKYTVTIVNNGDKKISNILIKNLIPRLSINSYTTNLGSFNKNTAQWSISKLESGKTAKITINVLTKAIASYKTTPQLTGGGFNLKNQTLSLNVVKGKAKFTSSSKDTKSGKNIIRTLKVKNSGTAKGSISKYIKIPSKYTYLKTTVLKGSTFKYYSKQKQLYVKVSNLNPGKTTTIKITMKKR
ncbi:right-handed parallel beta-helix repeat-containing protein [Methanobrevibacter curvatus]|uniref:DUF11 domain-containing protein n=1 Tax=Methanobrevibacter curvatus TaxID=49547 RepID=A0A166B4C9_9EURY|nr:right-handed parallel beta-helix repeat-containing protein [Methanobrevibacter curvatus]KZX12843.1 hypothetical protein MBCUR_08990 [Methanobrevibacter curvatus]